MRRNHQSLIIKLNYVEGPSNTSAEAASNMVRFSLFFFFPSSLLSPQSSPPCWFSFLSRRLPPQLIFAPLRRYILCQLVVISGALDRRLPWCSPSSPAFSPFSTSSPSPCLDSDKTVPPCVITSLLSSSLLDDCRLWSLVLPSSFVVVYVTGVCSLRSSIYFS